VRGEKWAFRPYERVPKRGGYTIEPKECQGAKIQIEGQHRSQKGQKMSPPVGEGERNLGGKEHFLMFPDPSIYRRI